VAPAYWLAQLVGGSAAARRLVPLHLVTPNLVLFGATSMDAVFLVFLLMSLATAMAALHRTSILRVVIAGAALWLAAFMSFAAIAVPVLLVAYALLASLQRPANWTRLLLCTLGIGVVFMSLQLLVEWTVGYDLIAAARAAVAQDYKGMQITGYESFTLWWQISLGNLLAFCFDTGLAAMALFTMALAASLWYGHMGQSRRRLTAFAQAMALGLVVLAGSTLFTLETERVWVFLAPAALVVGASQLKGGLTWSLVLLAQLAQTLSTELLVNTRW